MRRGAAAEAGAAPAQSIGTSAGVCLSFFFKKKGWGAARVPTRVPPTPAPATPTAADSGTSSAKWWSSFRRELPSAGSKSRPGPGRLRRRHGTGRPSARGDLSPVTHPQPHTVRTRSTNVPQRKRATSTTWDGTVGAGCRARPVQGPRVPPTGPTPGLHLSFTAIHP